MKFVYIKDMGIDLSGSKCDRCKNVLNNDTGIQYLLGDPNNHCKETYKEVFLCKDCAYDMAMGLLKDCEYFKTHEEYLKQRKEFDKRYYKKEGYNSRYNIKHKEKKCIRKMK